MNGAIILNTTYGYQPKGEKDEFVALAERAMMGIASAARPGAHLVDMFPFRMFCSILINTSLYSLFPVDYLPQWFPGAGFKKEAAELRQVIDSLVESPWKFTHNNLVRTQSHLFFIYYISLHWFDRMTKVSDAR